jgi:hypothetical protein
LREAFPFESAPGLLIFDRDAKYGFEVPMAIRSLKMDPVGPLSKDIIAIDERHLKRLISEYIRYYHEDRTHLGLEEGTPNGRNRAIASDRVLFRERLGWLHRRYDRAA